MLEAAPPHSTPLTNVGVVTVSYGSGDALTIFLRSLREYHGDLPVVVVDNKPDHESVQGIAQRYGAQYVPIPANPGYGAGMNAGVRALKLGVAAHTPLDAYFFCNPDVRFIEPAIGQLAASLLGDPGAGSIGPRILNEDGSVYPSARNIPSFGTGVGHALFSKIWPGNPWTRAYQDAANYGERRAAGSLSGAAVMVKRSAFEDLSGWDEAYFMHFEDIDLGWRIGNLGLTNVYEPSVSVEHSGAHSTKKHAVAVEQAMTDSAIRFMNKRYTGFWRSPLRWAIHIALRFRGFLKLAILRRNSKENAPS
ncbi:glycosyltransferase [Leucobacter sp. Z1108]|uniref:glycosyltransferase n=1 Tax=Leucobacter sp. Z1108 TaxID=3439066 RepID=UPI003F2FA59F